MSASRTSAASPSESSAWWRSIDAGDRLRQAPAAGEDAADEGVVDAELAALALDPLLGGAGLAVDLAGIAGVGVDEHELADVVQQRGHHQPVAGLVAELAREAVGGALGGDRVQAEALWNALPDGGALEEVERAGAARDRVDGARREHLDRLDRALDATAAASVDLIGEPQRRRPPARRRASTAATTSAVGGSPCLEQPHHAVARLDEHRERLERLERGGQTAAVTLVVVALARRVGISW